MMLEASGLDVIALRQLEQTKYSQVVFDASESAYSDCSIAI
jgi:hypothetical protein